MLKISQAGGAGQSATLVLEGQIVGQWVGELKSICEARQSQGRTFNLDLCDVTYADKAGVELLAQLQSRGVALKNCSPFMNEQLKSHGMN